jgi:hypothetical protein
MAPCISTQNKAQRASLLCNSACPNEHGATKSGGAKKAELRRAETTDVGSRVNCIKPAMRLRA